MPSTTRPTIDDLFAGLGRGQTTNVKHVFLKKMAVQLTAVAGTTTFVLGRSEGPIQIRSIVVTSVADLDGHATDNWTFDVQNTGIAGTATTSVASFITDTPTADKLTALVGKEIHSTTTPTSVPTACVLALVMTKAASAAAFTGRVEVNYLAEI